MFEINAARRGDDVDRRHQVISDLRRRLAAVTEDAAARVPLRLEPAEPVVPRGEPSFPHVGRFGGDRDVFEVAAPLAAVLPRGGLPRGGVVSLAGQGSTSLLLTLLASPSAPWSAVVGMPGLGLLAAAELGVDLDKVVVVPDPGPDVLQVLSVLVDGVDMVALAPTPGLRPNPGRLRVLNGRLRQRGSVLLVSGPWPGADLVLTSSVVAWSGLDHGHGRLRDRELTIQVRGRGAAGRIRETTMVLAGGRSGVEVMAGPAAGFGPAAGVPSGEDRPAVASAG